MREWTQTPECFASHMGLWAIEPGFLQQALGAIRGGLWRPGAAPPSMPDAAEPPAPPQVTADGVGLLPIRGPMQKGRSKFGGTSTVDVRRALRAMVADAKVGAIMLCIESPGGHVAGTAELAADVAAADVVKPVHAYIEDMGASAAYWVASQARSITANEGALVGSLGVFGTLTDTSKAAEMEGVKVHVIGTSKMKGAGTPGTPVTDEHLAEAQRIADGVDATFRAAVRAGRDMGAKDLDATWTGQTWLAPEAKGLGLLDRVEPFDAAMERIAGPLRAKAARARMGGLR